MFLKSIMILAKAYLATAEIEKISVEKEALKLYLESIQQYFFST